MLELTQTAASLPPKPQQLQMIWPRDRLHAPPPVTVHPDYDVRAYRPGGEDEAGWYRLMELAGFGIWDEERLAPIFARILPNGWFFAVHRETGTLAASAMACHEHRPLHPFGGALNWVCGDPAHRGKGLGMSVCAAATARLLAAGYEDVYLLTDDGRLPALAIYLKLGYQPFLYAPDMQARWQAVYKQLGITSLSDMTDSFVDDLQTALGRACQAQNISIINKGRGEILAMQKDAVVQGIERAAVDSLELSDEWVFRRLLELYEQLDRGLLQRLIETGLASSNDEIREAAEDFKLRV